MRYLTTSVALLAMVSAAVITPAAGRGQDGAGLRDALGEARGAEPSASGETSVPDAFPTDEAAVLLEPEELDALVAPVALYPDALLAQVLVAATQPLQVAKADQLIAASADMTEDELSDALARQDFDPSVLVLMAGFPTVVTRMAEDLDWTERLGGAMLAQDEDVLDAVQRMRAEAEAAGNLESNAAQIVEEDAGEIYIRPADPEVVYVPSYDPVTTYTTPYTGAYSTPYATTTPYGTSSLSPLQNPLVAGALAFGAALLVQELFGDDDDDRGDAGWNDYWQRSRPIAWRDREFYPRPPSRYASTGDAWSWRRERDRYWDGGAHRWRPEAARDARREALSRAVVEDPAAGAARMRASARERKEERARAAVLRRERAGVRAERARADDLRDERARAAALKRERADAAALREKREKAKAAALGQKQDAAPKPERDRAAVVRQERAKAAAERQEENRAAAKAAAAERKRDRAAAPNQKHDEAAGKAKPTKAAAAKRERARAAAAQAKAGSAQAQRPEAAASTRERAAAAEAERDAKAKQTKAAARATRAKAAKAEQAKTAAAKAETAKAAKAEKTKAPSKKRQPAKAVQAKAAAKAEPKAQEAKKQRAAAAPSRKQNAQPAAQKKAASQKKVAQKKAKKKCDPKRQDCKKQ